MPPLRSALALLAGLTLAISGLSACASKPRPATGDVVRTDEIAEREREAYALARQAAAADAAGNPEQAIDLYRRALGIWPEIPSAWNNLGLLLMEQNSYMDAVEAFKTAARQDPRDARPLVNVGVAYDRTGWADEALAAYLQALERHPMDHDALIGAIAANHRLLGADRAALDRVRTATMVETDPEVRAWLERERFRIESRLNSADPDEHAAPGTAPNPG